MGRLCILDSCSTNSCLIKPRDVQLHRFPSNPGIKGMWEEWVREVEGPDFKDFVATKSTHTLCSKHFMPSDYVRKRLCFKAVPSVPPEPSAEGSAGHLTKSLPVAISNVCSLAKPRPEKSPDVKRSRSKPIVKPSPPKRTKPQASGVLYPVKYSILPQRLQTQGIIRPVKSIIVPSRPLSHRLQASGGQAVKNTIPTYTFSTLGQRTDNGSDVAGAVTSVIYASPKSRLQESSSIQTSPQTKILRLASPPLRLTGNDSSRPGSDNKTPEEQVKRRCNLGDIRPTDLECTVKAQNSLKAVNSEIAKTKRKMHLMELKYVRAMKKIKTLMDMVNQCKEERNPVDEEMQIKVCSSCRKVNLCQ